MTRFLVVGLGGALGAMARYGVSLAVATFWRRDFPFATMVANVTGCFILGLLGTLAAERIPIDPLLRLLIMTGFVGAYTTFSTFEYETQRLVEMGAMWPALLNVVLSIAAGFAAVQLGVMLARR